MKFIFLRAVNSVEGICVNQFILKRLLKGFVQNRMIVYDRVGNYILCEQMLIEFFNIFRSYCADGQMLFRFKIPPDFSVNHHMVALKGAFLKAWFNLFKICTHIFEYGNV